MRLVSLVVLWAVSAAAGPTGLLCDYKNSPALGVRLSPHFGWIVPPCPHGADHTQAAYQIMITQGSKQVWDSGKVASSDSTYAAGPSSGTLHPGTPYHWTVTTWTSNGGQQCAGGPSEAATLITSLGSTGFSNGTKFISLPQSGATFGYFRKELPIPVGVVSATAQITAVNSDPLFAGYKLYINGKLADVGPGRGEAPVWGGDGQFRSLPYMTLELTELLSGQHRATIGLQTMHAGGPKVIMQLTLRLADGQVLTIGTDETWMALNADPHRRPGKPQHGSSAGTGFIEYIDARAEPVGWKQTGFKQGAEWTPAHASSPSASDVSNLHPKMEPAIVVTDLPVASIERWSPPAPPAPTSCVYAPEDTTASIGCPKGQLITGIDFASFGSPNGSCGTKLAYDTSCNSSHSMQVVSAACLGKADCQLAATCSAFREQRAPAQGAFCWKVKKHLAVTVSCAAAASPATASPATASTAAADSAYIAYFEKEIMGGVRLEVQDGVSGQNVHIACGESYVNGVLGSTWGWEFDWTLRDGQQTLEQHKYMECRWVMLTFSGAAPANFTVSGWKIHYPYVDTDSSFSSSNETLNAVWELSRYTLEGASLDTYTDSNTRERRPYEADGIIAATARLLVQRDVLWPRHSHAWVINEPTWPVEWQQLSPFLGWQDYIATGQPDLSEAFMAQMHDRSMIRFLDSTGLLETDHMGRHIVDWMPDTPTSSGERDETVQLGEFTASKHMSVSNAFAAHGLDLLSQVVGAGGHADNATQFAAESAALMNNIKQKMWNGSHYCDGICSEVNGSSLVMSNMFTLCFGMHETQASVQSAWEVVADWGLEEIGDYGSFWYFTALASGYYAPAYNAPGDGSAVLKALTKCDRYSWCSGLRDDNLTMTRESWHQGTYSHQWGTAPIVGVVFGVMGVHVTGPGWTTFTVMPKLASLEHASVTVPTLRGFIEVDATPSQVQVRVPCNTAATLCLPRSDTESPVFTVANTQLMLDGVEIEAVDKGEHLCVAQPVGCGEDGAKRRLTAQAR